MKNMEFIMISLMFMQMFCQHVRHVDNRCFVNHVYTCLVKSYRVK